MVCPEARCSCHDLHLLQRGWWAIRSVCEQTGYLMEWTFTVSWFFGTYSLSSCVHLFLRCAFFFPGKSTHLFKVWTAWFSFGLNVPCEFFLSQSASWTALSLVFVMLLLRFVCFPCAKLESSKCFAVSVGPNYCKAMYSFWLSPNYCTPCWKPCDHTLPRVSSNLPE